MNNKNKRKLKVVSLFDGISCGRAAIERLGYTIFSYHAFEIDKYARAIGRYNFPDTIQHGDVLNADFTQFKDIDLVIAGSPCQSWSIAKNNREVDKTGVGWQLFMKFVEAITVIRPRFFLYENVNSMPKDIKNYITEELGCESIMINSALVSAQQRKRLYWTNIPNVAQPNDKGILLKNILESGIPYQDKSHCITATYDGAILWNSLERNQRTMIAEPIALKDKSQTLCSTYYKENAKSMIKRGNQGLFVAELVSEEYGAALRTRADENGKFKRLEVREDGKTNALTTVLTDSLVCSPVRSALLTASKATPAECPTFLPVRLGQIGKGGQGERIYSVHGKTICISANGGGSGGKTGMYKINLPDGDYIVRKLTPIEAERCQTLPDNYTAFGIFDKSEVSKNAGTPHSENERIVKISNTQRYKSIGNGWTVDVIAHILSFMPI